MCCIARDPSTSSLHNHSTRSTLSSFSCAPTHTAHLFCPSLIVIHLPLPLLPAGSMYPFRICASLSPVCRELCLSGSCNLGLSSVIGACTRVFFSVHCQGLSQILGVCSICLDGMCMLVSISCFVWVPCLAFGLLHHFQLPKVAFCETFGCFYR